MQNDFISGALGSSDAKAIVNQVLNSIREAKKVGDTVIFTLDTHDDDYMATQEGKKLPVPHCVRGTWGHQLEKELLCEITEDMPLIEKRTFGSIELIEVVKQHVNADTIIEICGLCTDICVISNAMLIKAAFPENSIRVIESACAGVSRESHENALNAMRMCHIDVI